MQRFLSRISIAVASPCRICILLALALFCLPALAQTTGTLMGTVSDQSGAAVPKAKVTLLNENSGDIRETQTNEVGRFTFAGVRPATYTVKVSSDKFKGWQRLGFVMNAADTRDLSDIKLEIGAATESVTVEAANSLVDIVSNGERSALLETKDIERLPLIGRNVTELFKTLPGVSAVAMGGNNNQGFDFSTASTNGSPIGAGLSANGAPYRGGNMLLMDGANILDVGCNCWSIVVPNPEFTQEVKVQTANFGADQPNGPVVFSTISKSGGNKYHGSAYFTARNNALNSLEWSQANQRNPQKPDMAWYYPGGTFGGPVPGTKGKLMAWGGYEYQWQKLAAGSPLTSWVPTASMRAGNFSLSQADNAAYCAGASATEQLTNACAGLGGTVLPNGTVLPAGTTQLPASAIDPNMVRMMNAYFPQSNASNANYNWYLQPSAQQNAYVWRTRVDYDISESTKLFIGYQKAHQVSVTPAHIWWVPGQSVLFPGGGITSTNAPYAASFNLLKVFSPTMTNEMVVTFAKMDAPFMANIDAVSKATLGWTYRNVYGNGHNDPMIPSVYSAGARTFPDVSNPDLFAHGGFPMRKVTPTFADNLSKVYKQHTFKAGFYYAMPGNQQAGFNNPNGTFSFGSIDTAAQTSRNVSGITGYNGNFYGSQNPMANFLMGVATGYSENDRQVLADMVNRVYSFYGMDDWKVNRRLTLNLGMRFDHLGRWYERTGTGMAVWLPGLYQDDVNARRANPGLRWHGIDPGIPISGNQAAVLNLSPRIGMSWDVFGNGKTVIRGGWGLYRYNDEPATGGALNTAQMLQTYSLPSGTILASQIGPSLLSTQGGGVSGNAGAVDPNDHRVPSSRSYNLTISRQLPWRTLLEVAYVGNSTTNLLLGGQTAASGLGGGQLNNANKMPLGALFGPDPVTGAARPSDLESTGTSGTCTNDQAATCWNYTHYFPLWQGYGQNTVGVVTHLGYSNYNGLQVAWAKTQGALTFNANFSWSKALGIINTTLDAFNIDNNYGILAIDRPRVMNFTYAYDLGNRYKGFKVLEGAINGWTISGLTTFQSGPNWQASYAGQNLGLRLRQSNGTTNITSLTMYGTNANTILPIYTCDPGSGLPANTYINLSCVSAPAVPAPNTLARVGDRQAPYLAGPAYFNQDLSLRKSFKISERQVVQVGFNASNFFNHPNLNTTTGTLQLVQAGSGWSESGSSANFGRSVNNKTGQRILSFSAKYTF